MEIKDIAELLVKLKQDHSLRDKVRDYLTKEGIDLGEGVCPACNKRSLSWPDDKKFKEVSFVG